MGFVVYFLACWLALAVPAAVLFGKSVSLAERQAAQQQRPPLEVER